MSSPVNGAAIHSNANPSKKALPRYGAALFRKRCGKDLIFFHHHTLESDNLFPLHIVKTNSISTGLTG